MSRWQVAVQGVLQKHISATICISQVYRFPVSDGHLRRRIPPKHPVYAFWGVSAGWTPSQVNQNGQIRYTCDIHLLQAVPWPFPSQTSFHTGSVPRDSVPLRQVRLPVALSTGVSGRDSSSGSIPHWQRFPRFGAVAACLSCSSSPGRLSGRDSSSGSIPHWQHILWFSAVAVNGLA